MSKMYILWCTPYPHTDIDQIVPELSYMYPNAMCDHKVIRTNTLCKLDTEYFSIRFADPVHTNLEGLCYDAIFGVYEKVKFEILARLKDQNAKEWFKNHRGKNAMYNYIENAINTTVSKTALAYIDTDIVMTNRIYRNLNRTPSIKNVIFNDPATIVFWSDGTKTVVKTQWNECYDPEKGLAMAISKKALGNKGNYYNTFKKWLPKSPRLNLDMGVTAIKNLPNIIRDHMDSLKKDLGI